MAALPRPDPMLFFKRMLRGGGVSFGAVANLGIAVFLTLKIGPRLLPPDMSTVIGVALLAFFYIVGFLCLWTALSNTTHLKQEQSTPICQAVTFTQDESSTFEPAWRRFTFRNVAYAQQFRQLNAHLLWQSRGGKARKAASRRRALHVLGIAAFAIVVLYSMFEEYLRPMIAELWRLISGN